MAIGDILGGLTGGLYGMFAGPGASGRGKMGRVLEQQLAMQQQAGAYSNAMVEGEDNPLFARSMKANEIAGRRQLAEMIQQTYRTDALKRARGLTAGVRSEREDEARYRAFAGGMEDVRQNARENTMAGLARGAAALTGVSSAMGQTFAGLKDMSALNQALAQFRQRNVTGLASSLGGIGDIGLAAYAPQTAFRTQMADNPFLSMMLLSRYPQIMGP